jgi:hypothetical protein
MKSYSFKKEAMTLDSKSMDRILSSYESLILVRALKVMESLLVNMDVSSTSNLGSFTWPVQQRIKASF